MCLSIKRVLCQVHPDLTVEARQPWELLEKNTLLRITWHDLRCDEFCQSSGHCALIAGFQRRKSLCLPHLEREHCPVFLFVFGKRYSWEREQYGQSCPSWVMITGAVGIGMKHVVRCWIHLPGVVTRVAISDLLGRDITPGAMGKVCGISPFHLLGLPVPAPQLHICVVGRKSDLGLVSSRCQVVLTGLASMVSSFFPGQDSGGWRESCLLWTSWQKLPVLMLHEAQDCTCL